MTPLDDIDRVEIPRLDGYVLVAYAMREDLDTPYGYMQKRTSEDPNPYPEPVLVEGAIFEEETGEFFVLVKRTDPTFSEGDDDYDPEKLWGIGYDIAVPPENVSKIVGAQIYSEGTGKGCYPVDFELRMAYRHFYENGENVSQQWKDHYHGYIYDGRQWPGFLQIEGGRKTRA